MARLRLRQALYAPVLAFAMSLMFARILLMARILDVHQFADYSAGLLVASSVVMAGSFGLYYKFQRDLPALLYRNCRRRASVLLAQVILGSIIVGIVVLCLAPGWLSVSNLSAPLLFAGLLNGVAQQLFLIVTVVSRSRGKTLHFSIENLARAIGIVLVIVPIALATSSAVAVVLAEAAVSLVISLAILMRSVPSALRPTRVPARLSIRQLSALDWSAILALLAVSLVSFMSINVDRWIALEVLDKGDFGLYAFAWTIMVIALSVQALVNASLFPLIATRFAAYGRDHALRISAIASFGLLFLCALGIVPCSFAVKFLVPTLFPKYAGAVELVIPISVAASFRVADFWSSFLVIVGQEKLALVANIGSLCVGVVGWFLWVRDAGSSAIELAWLALAIAALNFTVLATASLIWRDCSQHIPVADDPIL